MKAFQKIISSILIVAILGTSFGMITGCDSSAKKEEAAREAEFQQQMREEQLRQAQEETRKKKGEADNEGWETVEIVVGIGAAAAAAIAWLLSGSGE